MNSKDEELKKTIEIITKELHNFFIHTICNPKKNNQYEGLPRKKYISMDPIHDNLIFDADRDVPECEIKKIRRNKN